MAAVMKPWAVAAVILSVGCANSTPVLGLPELKSKSNDGSAETLLDRFAPCDNAEFGTPCGPTDKHMHCASQVCVPNVCGDSVEDEQEECDDGNDNNQDGCTDDCHVGTRSEPDGQAGKSASGVKGGGASPTPGMGGAATRPSTGGTGGLGAQAGQGAALGGAGEQSCAAAVGGRGSQSGSAGEGLGAAAGSSGTGGATGLGGLIDTATPSAECKACREMHCRSYTDEALDLVGGCLEHVNPKFGASAQDPTFISECSAMVSCAVTNHCASGLFHAMGCYCGSSNSNTCASTGPATDAKCVPQVEAAARTKVPNDVMSRTYALNYPMAWGYMLLDCDRMYCQASCAPNNGVTTNGN